jgi:hypothetical protein
MRQRQKRQNKLIAIHYLERAVQVTSVTEKMPKNSFVSVLSHPITAVLVSAIGIWCSIMLYVINNADISPQYAVRNSDIIASMKDNINGLKIMLNNKQIDSARIVRMAIWNSGRVPIDKAAILANQPICINYPESVSILDYRVSATSRSNLNFLLHPASNGAHCLEIEIGGDEALEQDDGALVELLYAGPEDASFLVSGRVKGAKEGFQKQSWDRIVLKQKNLADWTRVSLMMLWSLTGIILYLKEIRLCLANKPNVIGLASYILFTNLFLNAWLYKPFFVGLSWAH